MIKKPISRPRSRGRPPLVGDRAPAQMLGIRMNQGLLDRLDQWRKDKGKTAPNRSVAARMLLEDALERAGF